MLQIHIVFAYGNAYVLETVLLIVICCHGNQKIGRQMAIKTPVSNDFSCMLVDSINVFDCRLSGVKLLKIS